MRKLLGIALVLLGSLTMVMRGLNRAPLQPRVRLEAINAALGRVGLILVVRFQGAGGKETVFAIENRRSFARHARLQQRMAQEEGRLLDEQMERYTLAIRGKESQRVQ